MRTRTAYGVGIACALAFGLGQLVVRSQGAPPAEELVPWEPYEALGQPPFDRPVLLEFSADWCVPCLRMQVTTFRDPEFLALLERYDLRPVRLEYREDSALEFERIQRRYGVSGLPALVILQVDGRFAPPMIGANPTEEYPRLIAQALEHLERELFWNEAFFDGGGDPGRVTVRVFDDWWYLDHRSRTDWRFSPSAGFSIWCKSHVDLVEASFPLHMRGVEYYRRWGVKSVPTLIALDHRNREIARFEGADAVRRAPGEIARLAREQGLGIPDPPSPYASGAE